MHLSIRSSASHVRVQVRRVLNDASSIFGSDTDAVLAPCRAEEIRKGIMRRCWLCRALLLLSHFRDLEYIVHTILLNILYTLLYCLTLFRDVSKSQNEHDLNICVLHVTRGESQLTGCEFRAVSSLLSFPTTIYTNLFSSFHFSKHCLHPNTSHTRTAYRRSLGLFTANKVA